MKVIIGLTLLVFWTVNLEATQDVDCCSAQKVGDFSYTLLNDDVEREFPEDCLTECAYTRDGEDEGPDYCFKPGDLQASCVPKDSEVSCGYHVASSCDKCPNGNGAAWCNGQCLWKDDKCVAKSDISKIAWSYPTEIAISKDNLLGTIPKLTSSFIIEFDLMITEWLEHNHSSILHFTTGETFETADAVPLIWSTPVDIQIAYRTKEWRGYTNHYVPNITLNKWTHFKISQLVEGVAPVYTVHINGKKIFSRNVVRTKELTEVKVYASCPWIPSQSGKIKNLNVWNFEPRKHFVIQARVHGAPRLFFQKTFQEYENGFSNDAGEKWLSLRRQHKITNDSAYGLTVILKDWDGKIYKAYYDTFKVGPGPDYRLEISDFDETYSHLGDSMTSSNGQPFHTKDRDTIIGLVKCSKLSGLGGWWYSDDCGDSPNGKNPAKQDDDDIDVGISWRNGGMRGDNKTGTWKWSQFIIL